MNADSLVEFTVKPSEFEGDLLEILLLLIQFLIGFFKMFSCNNFYLKLNRDFLGRFSSAIFLHSIPIKILPQKRLG